MKYFSYCKYSLETFEAVDFDQRYRNITQNGYEYFYSQKLWSEIQFKSRFIELLKKFSNQNKLTKEEALGIIESLSIGLEDGKREVFLIFPIIGAKISQLTPAIALLNSKPPTLSISFTHYFNLPKLS